MPTTPSSKLPNRNWLHRKKQQEYAQVDVEQLEAGGATQPKTPAPRDSRRSSSSSRRSLSEEATDESAYYSPAKAGLVQRVTGFVFKGAHSTLNVKMATVRRATRMTGDVIKHALDDPLDRGNGDKLVAFERLWQYVSDIIYEEVADESDLSPMQKIYRHTLVVGWRTPTPLRDAHGRLHLYEYLRSCVLYMLFPANKTGYAPLFYFTLAVLVTLFPSFGIISWLYLGLFCLIERTDEFQLVQYICLDKSIQFLVCGFLPAVGNGYQYLTCLQHIEAGDVGWCSQVYVSTQFELGSEPVRLGCVWMAFFFLANGWAHGGTEQTMALEAVRVERARSGLYDHASARAQQQVARRAVWRRMHETSAAWRKEHKDFDPDHDEPWTRHLTWRIDDQGNPTWWVDYEKSAGGFLAYFIAWDILTTTLVVCVTVVVIYVGQDNPSHYVFWKVFDFARMCQALLSFPFLIFALPLVHYPLTCAQPTGYDATGTLCPQLSGAQLRDCRDEDDKLVNEAERKQQAAMYAAERKHYESVLRDDLARIRKDTSLSEHERATKERAAKKEYTAKIGRLVVHEKEAVAASGGRKNSLEEKQYQSGSVIKRMVQGEVHLTISWTPKRDGVGSAATSDGGAATGESGAATAIQAMWRGRQVRSGSDSGSRAAAAAGSGHATATWGQLAVTLERGVGLKAMDANGLADPFVKLRWCSQKLKSKWVEEDLNPSWQKQCLRFHPCSLDALKGSGPLELEVKDHDSILKRSFKAAGRSHPDLRHHLANHESMGGASVDLKQLHDKVQKSAASDEVSIELVIKLCDVTPPPQAGPA